jgi:flagellar motor protein MotB
LYFTEYMNIRLHQFLCGVAGIIATTFICTSTLFSQTYRPERWQDGRPLRQGKFLIGAGWGYNGIGYRNTPDALKANPPEEPKLENPSAGTYTVAGSVGIAPMLDVGIELGGTFGGSTLTLFSKYAFLPYSSPLQAALLLSVGYSALKVQSSGTGIDSLVDILLRRPSLPDPNFLLRAELFTIDVSAPVSYDISPEWTLIAAPRLMWTSYASGVGASTTLPNGLMSELLTQSDARGWLYGFTIGAKAVRESPQWWQYLVPVPFLASGCMQMSFTWQGSRLNSFTLSYQHLFPSFGTLLTTVTQEEMDNIESDRRQKDSILAMQKQQIELERSRFGRALSAEIVSMKGTDEKGTIVENPTLRVEEFEAKESLPLLSMVFFEQNSSVIPARYRRLRSSDRMSFTMEHFARLKPTDMYRNLLNIVGKRMNAVSSATLTLTGVTSGFAEEGGNMTLAERRARAVMEYLVDVWKLSPQRFTIQTRAKQDTTGLVGELADNRRVELHSDNALEILADVETQEVARRTTPEQLTFGFDIAAGAGLKQWNLELTQLDGTEVRTLKLEAGIDASINKYTWNIGETRASVPLSGENIVARLEITDLTNRVAESALALLPVEYISLEQKHRSSRTDTKLTLVQRWIFGKERDTDTADSLAIAEIRRLVPMGSSIVIHTNLSAEKRNLLGEKLRTPIQSPRAIQVSSLATVLPEERMYARCVGIEVRTPISVRQ